MLKISALIAAMFAVAGAQAATVTYSFADPLATTEISESGSLGLFNSSLGTLTGATLTLDGANQTSITLTNGALIAAPTRLVPDRSCHGPHR